MNYSEANNQKRLRKHKSHAKKVKNKLGFVILRVFIAAILVGIFALGGAGIGAYMGIIRNAPSLPNINLDLLQGDFDTILLDTLGNEFERLDSGQNREFADWDQIPEHLINAFIAIEDERFWEHNGIDARGIVRAVYQTFFHDNTQGASTITQQLIKNQLGIIHNTVESKLQEQYLAIQYEALLTEHLGSHRLAKERIMHEYLNLVHLGHGQNGVQAASRFYFGKDVSELTLSESAVLASITQNPTRWSPINFPENNRGRQLHVLDNMLEQGLITPFEHMQAVNDDVFSRIQQVREVVEEEGRVMHFFADAVVAQLMQDLIYRAGFTRMDAINLIFGGGLTVYSTMNPSIQRIVDDTFSNESHFPTNPQDFELYVRYFISIQNNITNNVTHHERTSSHWVNSGFSRKQNNEDVAGFINWARSSLAGLDYSVLAEGYHVFPQPQASMIIIDHNTGQVVAMAGQRGEKQGDRTLNRAVDSIRQPGSVFKILAAYAPGFDMGTFTAATAIDDSPNIIFNWQRQVYEVWPRNWYSNPPFRGFQSVRRAIEDSMNVTAVKALDMVGIDNAFNYLQNFGFTTLTDADRVPALALGGINGVTNLEMTAAFGAIANGGMLYQTILYTRVYDRHGNVLIDNTTLAPTQVMNRNSAYVITDTMRGVLTRGTGGSARFQQINMDVAGKTGTTQEGRDLYFVGYTPHFTAGVWIGHDQPRVMTSNVTGGNRFDTRIWRYVMEEIHRELPNIGFTRPEGLVYHQICMDSGLLAIPGVCNVDPRGSRIRTELFAPGTVPTHQCNVHQVFFWNTTANSPSNASDPLAVRRVGIVRDRSFMSISGNVAIADASFEVPGIVLGANFPNINPDFLQDFDLQYDNLEEYGQNDEYFYIDDEESQNDIPHAGGNLIGQPILVEDEEDSQVLSTPLPLATLPPLITPTPQTPPPFLQPEPEQTPPPQSSLTPITMPDEPLATPLPIPPMPISEPQDEEEEEAQTHVGPFFGSPTMP